MALPWQILARVDTAEGPLELRRRGGEFLIVVAGRVLMTSAARRSEEALGALACARLPQSPRGTPPRLLVAGLGMGFTLRAMLDALPAGAHVDVAELSPEVVDWCRGPMASLTDGAVDDPRVAVQVADVSRVIAAAGPATWSGIVLDLYEGPYAPRGADPLHDPLFGPRALAAAHRALVPGGVLGVWSEDADPGFLKRLQVAGFTTQTHRSGGAGGRRHIIYFGNKRHEGARGSAR